MAQVCPTVPMNSGTANSSHRHSYEQVSSLQHHTGLRTLPVRDPARTYPRPQEAGPETTVESGSLKN